MGDAEVLVDLRQERADADELRAQRQGAQEQCGKEPQSPHGRTITLSAPSTRSVKTR